MKRRQFLGTAGALGVSSLAGCGGRLPSTNGTPTTGGPTPTPGGTTPTESPLADYADRFGTVVDLAERGADTAGEESIVGLLEAHLADDTLVYLPPGTYLVDDMVTVREFSNLGILGRGARIRPEPGWDSILFDLGRAGRATDLLVDGLEFDIRAPNTGPRPLSIKAGGAVTVRDVSVVGSQDAGWGMMRADVTDPDGVAVIERMRLAGGSTVSAFSPGFFVGAEHRGAIHFVDCTVVGFSNNGLYAQPVAGSVSVLRGYYANCGIASLRVGDNSVIRGAHVRCDRAPPDFENMRGIRLREGSDVLVENCLIEMLDVTDSDGGLVMAPWLESATVRNTTIRVDAAGVTALVAKAPEEGIAANGEIRVENVRIEGAATSGTAVQILGRDNCRIENVHIVQRGAARDGILFKDSAGAVLRDVSVEVGARPIVLDESTVERVNVRTLVSRSAPPF